MVDRRGGPLRGVAGRPRVAAREVPHAAARGSGPGRRFACGGRRCGATPTQRWRGAVGGRTPVRAVPPPRPERTQRVRTTHAAHRPVSRAPPQKRADRRRPPRRPGPRCRPGVPPPTRGGRARRGPRAICGRTPGTGSPTASPPALRAPVSSGAASRRGRPSPIRDGAARAAHRNGVPVLGNVLLPPAAYGGRPRWAQDSADGGFPVADKSPPPSRSSGSRQTVTLRFARTTDRNNVMRIT